jgi:glutathione S-transferase
MEDTMALSDHLTFYHSPNTRSTGVRILLEELAAPHRMVVLNMRAGEQLQPAFLAINPLGKVPALTHRGELITEQVAIYLYLADLFPAAGLAPAVDDRLRGPYLRWLAFYGSSFEPAVVDRATKREPAPRAMSPYGSYDDVMRTINQQLEAGPYLLGERMTAADILWGTALAWTTMFGIVEATPAITGYIERMTSRAAARKIQQSDTDLAAAHQAAASRAAASRAATS